MSAVASATTAAIAMVGAGTQQPPTSPAASRGNDAAVRPHRAYTLAACGQELGWCDGLMATGTGIQLSQLIVNTGGCCTSTCCTLWACNAPVILSAVGLAAMIAGWTAIRRLDDELVKISNLAEQLRQNLDRLLAAAKETATNVLNMATVGGALIANTAKAEVVVKATGDLAAETGKAADAVTRERTAVDEQVKALGALNQEFQKRQKILADETAAAKESTRQKEAEIARLRDSLSTTEQAATRLRQEREAMVASLAKLEATMGASAGQLQEHTTTAVAINQTQALEVVALAERLKTVFSAQKENLTQTKDNLARSQTINASQAAQIEQLKKLNESLAGQLTGEKELAAKANQTREATTAATKDLATSADQLAANEAALAGAMTGITNAITAATAQMGKGPSERRHRPDTPPPLTGDGQ
jgi:chromosome segregation ATPase